MMKKRIFLIFLLQILIFTSCRIPTDNTETENKTVEVTPTESTPLVTPTPTIPVTPEVTEEPVITPTPVIPTEEVNNKDVQIIDVISSFETISIKWKVIEGVDDYNVYYKQITDTTYKLLDKMLIRIYNDYYQADIIGISAGNYDVKVIKVKDNVEFGEASNAKVNVISHDRSGFSFKGESAGAYNLDGTLKSNAQVIYVTKDNAKTVTANVNGETQTGLQTILDAKQKKNTNNDILCIRIIGTITLADLDHISSSSEGLQIKGRGAYENMNITIEGVGNDATFNGFGLLIRNCSNVEIRNLGFINFIDDGISIDTNNSNLWIHNNDFYYGSAGGDKDQAKGDGSLDIKKSKYITVSYNHFWDSGKCCLVDAATGEGSNYITYHHNWFDHSDSRMPRVRNANVHVYNNYFDGVSKYGIGAAGGGSSVFSEGNYFRNTKHAYLSSKQGTDALGEGTFSGEDGGIIKAFNDYIEGGNKVITYKDNNISFDVYVASTKDEVISNTIKTLSGGFMYSNFDTSTEMYDYFADTPAVAKQNVIVFAGRLSGGDIVFKFNDSEDTNYEIISELKSIVVNYKSKLVKTLGENIVAEDEPTIEPTLPNNPTINNKVVHNFTVNGLESEVFKITGNISTSKGTVNYNDLVLSTCLKIESSTNITFTINTDMTLILVFGGSTSASGKKIKVDDIKYEIGSDNIVRIELEAGTHSITKADSINLFYIEINN